MPYDIHIVYFTQSLMNIKSKILTLLTFGFLIIVIIIIIFYLISFRCIYS